MSIEKLRQEMKGQVIGPDDAGYEAARKLFSGNFDPHPALIARVVDARDVTGVIRHARETGAPLAVRSGGHSGAGYSSVDGSIVLDLAGMKGLDIDTNDRTAWAQSGLTAAEYTTAAGARGRATGFGDTGSVGIGGITLGGGIGFLVRKHGMTIDALLAAEIVTADGELLRVDEENHPDLFWAIRGGGGNFGVATRFHYRLQPVDRVVGGMLMQPASPEIVAQHLALAGAAPEELTTIANVMTAPPMPFVPEEYHGKLVLMVLVCYVGDPAVGERVLAPFRALATPIVDMVAPIAYPEIYGPEDEEYRPKAVGRTMFLDTVDVAVAETIFKHLEASDAPIRVAQLRVLGGAMARVPSDATAFAHRTSKIMANLAAFFDGPEDKIARDAWVETFASDIRQGDGGAYVNFLAEEGPGWIRRAYPDATWTRLSAIKAKYDPDNVFRLNHNIPPAA